MQDFALFLQGFECRGQGCHTELMLCLNIIFNTLHNVGIIKYEYEFRANESF